MAIEVVLETFFTFPSKPRQPFGELEANMPSVVERGVLVTGSEELPQPWVQLLWGENHVSPWTRGFSVACRYIHLLLMVCFPQCV